MTITATLMKNILDDEDIAPETMENLIDDAVDKLNTFGASLSNLTGTAGTKTGTYTSAEEGAIKTLTRECYKIWSNPDATSSATLGPAGHSYSVDLQLLNIAKMLAEALKTQSGNVLPIYVSNDPVPT
jgi:hypothetical protein